MALLRLLVEWDDYRGISPTYGIVKMNSLVGNVTNLQGGQIVFVKDNQTGFVRQARILKISDDKNYLKQEKNLLDRESQNMKHFLLMFRRAFTEMKMEISSNCNTMTESYVNEAGPSHQNMVPPVTCDESSDTSSENATVNSTNLSYNFALDTNNSCVNSTVRNMDENNFCNHSIVIQDNLNQNGINIPLEPAIDKNALQLEKKATADKETQCDNDNISLSKVNNSLKSELNRLYSQTLNLFRGLGIDFSMAAPNIDTDFDEMTMTNGVWENGVSTEQSEIKEYKEPTERIESNKSADCGISKKNLDEICSNEVQALASTLNNPEETTKDKPEMVAIGMGNTSIPAHIFYGIDWSSYTTATRKLLEAVFPRSILATHSLTGKPSPAFKDNPGKKRLESKFVDDIVYTVVEKCQVPPSRVRGCITIKCTDEAKRYRMRQESINKRKYY